jgi:hypothetical protein
MPFDILKQQRGSTGTTAVVGGRLRNTIGDLSYFEDRIDFGADALKFAGAVERGDPIATVVIGQGASSSCGETEIIENCLGNGEIRHDQKEVSMFALRKCDRSRVLNRGAMGRVAAGAGSLGALAIGAAAVGAFAVGAIAVGRLALGTVVIKKAHIKRLEVDELVIGGKVIQQNLAERL